MASKKKEKEEEEGSPVWAELPAEVQSNILCWLPLRPLFRCKLVCKLWNSTISSPSFTHFPSHRSRPGNRPWLIFFPKSFDFLVAFDFDGLSWFKFDVGFLLPMLDGFHVQTLPPPSDQRGLVWCTGTALGLLMLDFCSSLYVCNPLTKSLFRLPPFKRIEVIFTQGFSASHMGCILSHVKTSDSMSSQPRVSSPITRFLSTSFIRNNEMQGFLMPTDSGKHASQSHLSLGKVKDVNEDRCPSLCARDFSVLVIGKANREICIEAYCSNRNSWVVVGSIPTSFVMKHGQMIECNGVFYSLLLKPFGMLVVGESTDNGMASWRIQDMPINDEKGMLHLLACQNCIFMVFPVDVLNKGFIVWRYETNSSCWIKMHDMPDYILEDVKSVAHSNWVDCVGVGSFICFRALGTFRVLSYDICNELWSWLPEPPASYGTVFTRGHQFEPRLDLTQFV